MKPAIPNSGRVIDALRESMQIADRTRGNVLDSFLRVDDLVESGAIRVDALGRIQLPSPAWTPAIFANSWVNTDITTYSPAGYYKDAFNRVHLRGLISSGTVGSEAFILPVGFRPELRCVFASMSNGAIGRVDVYSDGRVIPVTPSNNAYVSIEGFSFVAHH